METGGDDNITYTVRYRIERDQTPGPWKTFTTKELQMVITDLDNKVQYKFEVLAKTKGGESLPDERCIQTNFPGGNLKGILVYYRDHSLVKLLLDA